MPRPENPLGAPVDAVGGPRDCRVSLAGLVGLTGVVDGDGPGDGDRWGRRVCEAMMRSMGDVYDDQPRDRSCTWGQRKREEARGCGVGGVGGMGGDGGGSTPGGMAPAGLLVHSSGPEV